MNRNSKLKYILLISLLCIFPLKAQYDFKQFGEESWEMLKSPVNWNEDDLLKFGAISLGTAALMQFDDDIREFALDNSEYQQSIPAEFGRIWGEPLTSSAFALGFSLLGHIQDNSANKRLAFELAESTAGTISVIGLIKFTFGRARPLTGLDQYNFDPYSFKGYDYMSFASGHTALGFSLSTVLADNINNDLGKYLIYVPAVMTAASRIYQNHHWLSDVFFGAFTGYFIAKFFVDKHKDEQKPLEHNSYSPIFSLSLGL